MRNLKIGYSIIFAAILLVSFVLIPVSATVNNSKVANNTSDMPEFEEWVKPMDLSEYNGHKPQVKQEPLSPEELEKTSPFIIALNESEKKELNSIPKETTFQQANFESGGQISINIPAKSTELSESEGKTRSNPDVKITEVTYQWYWVQDTIFNNYVIIHNYGTSTVSGKVLFWSAEDGYGSYKTFSNLAPDSNTTVTVPFKPTSTQSSIGIKPIALEVRVDPDDISTHFVWMPYDGIEKYNNDVNHLSDPDGGDNLEISDLYHFPFNEGYRIISEAAVAGDNTITPYETANEINKYVHDIMHYDEEEYLDRKYTAADLWIVNHKNASGNYIGVCDEYATLSVSFARSLGVPSKYYYMGYLNMSNNSESGAHAISEIWDGNEWIHSDPTWKSFNNPQIYVQGNYSNIKIWNMKNADDSRDNNDPLGDLLLHFWNDFERDYLGELVKYN
ncbi:MAG: transglutaminase-like domain-containing protein [Methanolobus sp.]|nr:transglutaminase-like domain-containing protein [Methanolobus sp.]